MRPPPVRSHEITIFAPLVWRARAAVVYKRGTDCTMAWSISVLRDALHTFFRKAVRGAREEIALFYTRPLLAQGASNALPQLTLNRTRTALLRAGGLRIGQRSLVMGPLILTGVGDRHDLFSV